MRTQTYDIHKLRALLKRRKIARMDELKDALEAKADITVFRKLNELVCYSSYSHRGSYYTLDEIANFDSKASIIQRVSHAQSVVIGKGVTGLRLKCCIYKKQLCDVMFKKY